MSSATFTCFPDLPKQLRDQIWAEASNLPQLTILEFAANGEGDYEFEFTEIPNSGLFAILQACSGSREIAPQKYRPTFAASHLTAANNNVNKIQPTAVGPLYICPYCFRQSSYQQPRLASTELNLERFTTVAFGVDMIELEERYYNDDEYPSFGNYLYDFMQCFVWSHPPDEIITVKRWRRKLPHHNRGDLHIVELYRGEVDRPFDGRLSDWERDCSHPPSKLTFGKIFGEERQMTPKAEFEMWKFKLMDLARGDLRL